MSGNPLGRGNIIGSGFDMTHRGGTPKFGSFGSLGSIARGANTTKGAETSAPRRVQSGKSVQATGHTPVTLPPGSVRLVSAVGGELGIEK